MFVNSGFQDSKQPPYHHYHHTHDTHTLHAMLIMEKFHHRTHPLEDYWACVFYCFLNLCGTCWINYYHFRFHHITLDLDLDLQSHSTTTITTYAECYFLLLDIDQFRCSANWVWNPIIYASSKINLCINV